MAIENNTEIGATNVSRVRRIRNASKSFTSSAGSYANSFMSVPTGETWELQSVRINQNEGAARDVSMKLADGDGTTHAILTMDGSYKISCPAGESVGWNGSIMVPEGWRIYTEYYDLTGGSNCNWQFMAVAYDTDSDSPTIL